MTITREHAKNIYLQFIIKSGTACVKYIFFFYVHLFPIGSVQTVLTEIKYSFGARFARF